MKTCNSCEFLALTEEEQNIIKRQSGETLPHICNKYNKIVRHYPFPHPKIRPCKECIADRKESEDME